MLKYLQIGWFVLGFSWTNASAATEAGELAYPISPMLVKEFIFESPPFQSCHASTIIETREQTIVAAWFGGKYERASDVAIWMARKGKARWSSPTKLASGSDAAGKPLPTWNPVLFQPSNGPLMLFYKVGPSPAAWWGMLMTSSDSGATWSKPKRLPKGILGPVKDKPIQLSDGSLLCPSSDQSDGWKLHMETTTDLGKTWTRSPALNEGHKVRQIQPTLLDHGHGNIQLLSRTDAGKIFQCWSADNGKTWEETTPTDLPNPNSGIDAVQLKDGRSLVVFNPSAHNRHPLAITISADGRHWGTPIILEDTDGPELSYPAVIQTSDGKVHITYTWERKRIRHVVIDPANVPLVISQNENTQINYQSHLLDPRGNSGGSSIQGGGDLVWFWIGHHSEYDRLIGAR